MNTRTHTHFEQVTKWTNTLCGLLNTRALLYGKIYHLPAEQQEPFIKDKKGVLSVGCCVLLRLAVVLLLLLLLLLV